MRNAARRTELEGAVLGVIDRRPGCTAYQVRKEFLDSPSAEWSGSAGAVYPAISRLAEQGLIRRAIAERGEALSLTAAGERALLAWVEDAKRAASAGTDPFRMRSGLLLRLPADRRRRAAQTLRKEISAQVALIHELIRSADAVDATALELTLDLQKARLKWLDRLAL